MAIFAAFMSEITIPYWQSRTQLLLGDEKVNSIRNKHVLIAGLGGVGGICAEMIARSGVGTMSIVDADTVDLSNCNRQIPALHSTAGRLKVDVMEERLKDINPDIIVHKIPHFLKDASTNEILKRYPYDYAVDCIDTLSPKVYYIKACKDLGIPIVSSLGAGGKVNPALVKIVDISETYQCNLARYVRKYLHKLGVKDGLKVVFSPEPADQDKIIETPNAFPKKSIIGTISYMPAIFGLMCASVVIQDLMQTENNY
jgi:tRNA threonylcarbamoyladenosine dehydratase